MLGTHTEYIPLLREEIERVERENFGTDLPLKKLRLMDSFLRETSRLNPLDGRKYQSRRSTSGSHVHAMAIPQARMESDKRSDLTDHDYSKSILKEWP